MDILYCSYVRETRFIESIQDNLKNHGYYIATNLQDVLKSLEFHEALVFVGKQANIFSQGTYFDLQTKAREQELPLIAILGERETLYGNNRGLNKIIQRSERPISKIAQELSSFLNL